jgi:hypothetical protein
MSGAVGNLLRSPGPEAPPSRPPPGPSIGDSRSTRAPAERQTLEEKVGQPAPMVASMPARLQGQPISYKEFISAVVGFTWIRDRCSRSRHPRKAPSHDRATLQEGSLEVKRASLPILVPQPGPEQMESCHAI